MFGESECGPSGRQRIAAGVGVLVASFAGCAGADRFIVRHEVRLADPPICFHGQQKHSQQDLSGRGISGKQLERRTDGSGRRPGSRQVRALLGDVCERWRGVGARYRPLC